MRAVRIAEFGGPEVITVGEVDRPEVGAGQVLVKIIAAGVNPVDTYIRTGNHARRPKLPYTPGMDGAGVIEAVGADVTHLSSGMRVYVADSLTGTYAEYALCRADQVYRLPDNITFSQGAAVSVPYATAYYGLFLRGNGHAGETVLIHGASGGVGVAATQLAYAAGFHIIGTAGSEKGLQLVREQGAHVALNHNDANYTEKLLQATDGKGVDMILEMLANVNLATDLGLLTANGRVVVIGNRGQITIDPRLTMTRNTSIIGLSLMNATASELKIIHSAIYAGLEIGNLRPIVGREFALTDAAEAHKAVMTSGAYGKIVLTI